MKAAERQEFNEQLKAAAFTAWRIELAISSLFGGQAKISFPDYAEKMGLLTEKEIRQNEALKELRKIHNKQIAEEASRRADEIMRIDMENMRRERERQEAEKGGK